MVQLVESGDAGPRRTALILYGSETGTAQDVADELDGMARRLRFSTCVKELNAIDLKDLVNHDVVLIAVSTTGQGALPLNAQLLWKKLLSARLPPGCLSRLQFAVFGLGDSSYIQYNWASRKLSKRLRQLGGQLFYDCGESDEQHPEGINGTFLPWVTGLRKKLIDHYPLMSGIAPLPDDVYLEPKWVLEAVKPNGQMPSQTELDSNSVMPKSQESHSFDDPIFVPGGVEATLLSNLRLTPDEHWQDVRFLELSTARREYYPGDVLTIYPKNFSEDVESILALMGWADHADDLIEFSPNLTLSSLLSAGPTPLAEAHGFLTLRKLLTDYLDITSIPRRSFFAAISHFTNDEVQKERLIEFTNPELVDELYDYTTRPRRSILEVLQEFHTVKIPLKYITSIIPFMRGRQFSIASGGALKQNTAGRSRVQLLIALVRYRTVLKKMRQGLCTRYISCLHPGTRITVSFSNSGLKVDYRRPSVMIGPGTGVAPLRSMIYEKAAMHKDLAQGLPKQLLFFGGRNRKADYFFESDWTSLSEQGNLDVITAFSRDGETKYYVQDAIRSHASLIYEVLQTGVVYVCGSSGKMPQAVREALIDVFEQEGAITRLDAQARLTLMEKTGRYQQETW